MTERVVIASKGRFDRARSAPKRRALRLPSETDLTADEFMELTLDLYNMLTLIDRDNALKFLPRFRG